MGSLPIATQISHGSFLEIYKFKILRTVCLLEGTYKFNVGF